MQSPPCPGARRGRDSCAPRRLMIHDQLQQELATQARHRWTGAIPRAAPSRAARAIPPGARGQQCQRRGRQLRPDRRHPRTPSGARAHKPAYMHRIGARRRGAARHPPRHAAEARRQARGDVAVESSRPRAPARTPVGSLRAPARRRDRRTRSAPAFDLRAHVRDTTGAHAGRAKRAASAAWTAPDRLGVEPTTMLSARKRRNGCWRGNAPAHPRGRDVIDRSLACRDVGEVQASPTLQTVSDQRMVCMTAVPPDSSRLLSTAALRSCGRRLRSSMLSNANCCTRGLAPAR